MYSNNKYKRKGFMMISAIMSMLIILMIAHGFMTMFGGQFTYLSAGKTAAQGQQFAELIGEKVKLEGIDAEPVTTKTSLDTLTGNSKDKNWLYTYEISDGTTDENGNTFKVATIKVYKEGETSPRYTQEIPLSSLRSISSFNTPDFSKVIVIHNGFECPANGWINVYRGIYNYGMRVYVNDILVPTAWLYWDCAYNRDEQNYNIIPVQIGDKVTFSGGNNGVYFTPVKVN